MAKTTFLTIPPELEELYYTGLQSGDRFVIPKIRPKNVILSRKRIEGLTRRSYLPAIAVLWHAFTDQQRADWKAVSPYARPHGWASFVADQSKRIKFGIGGTATPNADHQDMVGKLEIVAPASILAIIQPHPETYWVSRKVAGKKRMYEPVEVNESLTLPLKITISYKSDLAVVYEGGYAEFYVRVRHLYQGQNLYHKETINIPLQSGWAKQDATISTLAGTVASYDLVILLFAVRGTLLIDLIKSEHSGSNWARDPLCKKIEQSFTRGFYQVPKHWAPTALPEGSDYESIYPT